MKNLLEYINLSCIYCIKNTVTGRMYIGSTMNLFQRVASHKTCLNSNSHINKAMVADKKKYGIHSFEIIVLEKRKRKDLLICGEQKFIDKYNDGTLYNIGNSVFQSNSKNKFLKIKKELTKKK